MNYKKMEDAILVSMYIQNNESAFAELLRRHKSKVFSTIYQIVKDRYVAEDLMQDVFIKAIHKIKGGQYNEDGRFLPWIIRIARNYAIDYFRKEKRKPTVILEDGSYLFDSMQFSEKSIENITIIQENEQLVRLLIENLPAEQREVVKMRHYEDMSFQEIADATGVSINTALGRMRYALTNLRKALKMHTKLPIYDQNFYKK
jgi:RNA polymerase sigma-70 factor (ECF subfamily)